MHIPMLKDAARVVALSNDVRTAIESAQPYNRLHELVPPVLSVLRDLDDADKHRLLNVAIAQQYEGRFRNVTQGIPSGGTLKIEANHGAIVDGTEIAALVFPSPVPDMNYQFTARLGISLRHHPGPSGAEFTEVAALLRLMLDEVRYIVRDVGERA